MRKMLDGNQVVEGGIGGIRIWYFCCLVTKSCLILLWSYEPQCASLSCTWDSPGKNTRVSCHFLPQGNLADPGIKPKSLALAGGFFTTESLGKPIDLYIFLQFYCSHAKLQMHYLLWCLSSFLLSIKLCLQLIKGKVYELCPNLVWYFWSHHRQYYRWLIVSVVLRCVWHCINLMSIITHVSMYF